MPVNATNSAKLYFPTFTLDENSMTSPEKTSVFATPRNHYGDMILNVKHVLDATIVTLGILKNEDGKLAPDYSHFMYLVKAPEATISAILNLKSPSRDKSTEQDKVIMQQRLAELDSLIEFAGFSDVLRRSHIPTFASFGPVPQEGRSLSLAHASKKAPAATWSEDVMSAEPPMAILKRRFKLAGYRQITESFDFTPREPSRYDPQSDKGYDPTEHAAGLAKSHLLPKIAGITPYRLMEILHKDSEMAFHQRMTQDEAMALDVYFEGATVGGGKPLAEVDPCKSTISALWTASLQGKTAPIATAQKR